MTVLVSGKGSSPFVGHTRVGVQTGEEVQVRCLCLLMVFGVISWSSYMMGPADIQA